MLELASVYASEHVELICTGRDMRWIDPLASADAGHFVFVDAPEEAPASLQEPGCQLALWQDQVSELYCVHSHTSMPVLVHGEFALLSADVRVAAYSRGLSRAPPTFLFIS